MEIRNIINIRKGSPGGHLMDIFHAAAKEARNADQYLAAQAYDTCVSAVNNIRHGLHVTEYFPRLRNNIEYFIGLEQDGEEQEAYVAALGLFEEYVDLLKGEFGPIEFNWETN